MGSPSSFSQLWRDTVVSHSPVKTSPVSAGCVLGLGGEGRPETPSGSSRAGNGPSRQQGGGGVWFLFPVAFYLEGGCCGRQCHLLFFAEGFSSSRPSIFNSLKHLQPGMEHMGSRIIPPRKPARPGAAAGMSPSGVGEENGCLLSRRDATHRLEFLSPGS